MANTVIQLRHSTVTGNVPSSLANGEISINSQDGKFFYSTPSGSIVTHYPFTGPTGLDTEIQFNDSGVLGSSDKLTFNKTTGLLQTTNLTASNVTTQTFIQFGDGSKQYTANAGSGGGGSSNSFATIANTTTSLIANTSNTRLTIVGESGIAVAMNTTTNQITVAANYIGAQGLTVDYGYVTEPTYYGFDYGYLS